MRTSIVGAVIMVVLSACQAMEENPNLAAQLQLVENRQKWSAQTIHAYSFDYDRISNAFSLPVHIEVSGDKVARVTDRTTGVVYPNAGYPTVDSLFAEIERAIPNRNGRVSATYDTTLGYPTVVSIGSNIPDTGNFETVTNFLKTP
jgi:hypothetical protein